MDLMKKALKLEWSNDMEKDFKELKAEFTAWKLQAYLDFDSNEPFILTMDWSALNIASILFQSQTQQRKTCGEHKIFWCIWHKWPVMNMPW